MVSTTRALSGDLLVFPPPPKTTTTRMDHLCRPGVKALRLRLEAPVSAPPRSFAAIVVVFGVCLCAGAQADSQAPSGTENTVSALLTEVRALRIALETVGSASASGQLTLGRLQLQERRLNAAIARLERTRERLAEAQEEYSSAAGRGRDAGGGSQRRPRRRCHDACRSVSPSREQIDGMLKGQRTLITATTAEIQRLTVEEGTLAGDVALEQSRWSELNRHLEEIERSLAQKIR